MIIKVILHERSRPPTRYLRFLPQASQPQSRLIQNLTTFNSPVPFKKWPYLGRRRANCQLSCCVLRPLSNLNKTCRTSGINVSKTSGVGSSERQRSSTVRKSPVIELISLYSNKKKRNQKKKTLQIKARQNRSLNSVWLHVPQVDLMLRKGTDGEVELIANLHIHITNIAFRGLFNTPKS